MFLGVCRAYNLQHFDLQIMGGVLDTGHPLLQHLPCTFREAFVNHVDLTSAPSPSALMVRLALVQVDVYYAEVVCMPERRREFDPLSVWYVVRGALSEDVSLEICSKDHCMLTK